MILTKQQIEEIEHWASGHFALSRNDFLNLLETVKDLQAREHRARELLKRVQPYVRYHNKDLISQIEEHLK